MAVTIAEYLGQRTDSKLPIQPLEIEDNQVPLCPFNDEPCIKMSKKQNAKPPVCSLRKLTGQYYIVCANRLLSTSVSRISDYQKDVLLQASQTLFNKNIRPEQVAFRTEVTVRTVEIDPDAPKKGNPRADYILAVIDDDLPTIGPRRLITEVQGGGETNSTGSITRHLEEWATNTDRTNELLRSRVNNAGTIETNAWRRLQEQIFSKGTTAKKTGYGFAALIGEVLFNYIVGVLPAINDIRLNPETEAWDVAFVVFKEVPLAPESPIIGSVPLVVDQERSVFTSLESLMVAMVDRGRKDTQAFSGQFTTISGQQITL